MLAKGITYEDIAVGMEIPRLVKGPMTPMHIMRWSAATENWHRIHYDQPFAMEHDKLPNVLVNGSWKQHVMVQLVKDWVGHTGWVWRISFQFRAMDLPGDTLTGWGRVTDKYIMDGLGYAELEIGIANQEGRDSTPGKATIVVPLRDGRPVPYPFVPPAADATRIRE